MKRRKEAVVFDLGNVVLKFDKGIQAIARLTGKPIDKVKEVFSKYDNQVCSGELTVEEYCRLHFGNTDAAKSINFPSLWASYFERIEESHKFIFRLAEEGYKLGILSNIFPDVFEYAEKNGTIPQVNWFGIILSCNLRAVKPDEFIYKATELTLREEGSNILFIDDRLENFIQPKKLGWGTVLFDPNDPENSINEIRVKLKV